MSAREASTTWGVGEYQLMAERLEPAAMQLVELAAIGPSDRVLDLGCGTGNAALSAARRASMVVGVDLEPRLLAIAASRASALGVSVEWVCDDAISPELPAHAFSVVLSAFGVMYVPDQAAAAAALARVSAPGARIVLASWTPDSFMPTMGTVLGHYLPPPPPGSGPPSRWGDEAAVAELLRSQAIEVHAAERARLDLDFADLNEAVDFLIRTAGNVLAERQHLDRGGRWHNLTQGLEDLVRNCNQNTNGSVQLGCEYLLVRAKTPDASGSIDGVR